MLSCTESQYARTRGRDHCSWRGRRFARHSDFPSAPLVWFSLTGRVRRGVHAVVREVEVKGEILLPKQRKRGGLQGRNLDTEVKIRSIVSGFAPEIIFDFLEPSLLYVSISHLNLSSSYETSSVFFLQNNPSCPMNGVAFCLVGIPPYPETEVSVGYGDFGCSCNCSASECCVGGRLVLKAF